MARVVLAAGVLFGSLGVAHAGDDLPVLVGGGVVVDGGGGATGVIPSIEALVRVRGDAMSSVNLRARFGYGLVVPGQTDGGLGLADEIQVFAGLEGHVCGTAGSACFVIGASAGYEKQDITFGIAGFGGGGSLGFELGSPTTRFRAVLDVMAIHATPQDAGLPGDMEHWAVVTSVSFGVIHEL